MVGRKLMEIMMTKEQRQKLPKASLIHISWGKYSYIAKSRGANFMRVQIGRMTIVFRMPWLEHSARRLYPQLF